MFDIQQVLVSLANKRPVFHNEADFQHALAWEIRESYDCKIRLEKRMDIRAGKRSYLDVWVEHQGKTYGIELKYKIRGSEYVHDGETFSFLNQAAHDIGRYDVTKDLQRLEQMVSLGLVDEGVMILLTNDAAYYREPSIEKFTADRDFRIHEGRLLAGELKWSEFTGEGTMKGRTDPISLQGRYTVKWQDYRSFGPANFVMKMLLIPIRSNEWQSSEVNKESTEIHIERLDHVEASMPIRKAATLGTTERVRAYIREQLHIAKLNGDAYCDLISGDIHRLLALQSNMPTVCQAMISIPEYRFEILQDSPSGKTSTKKIRYVFDRKNDH